MSCPNNAGGFCSREDCHFILNGGCAWLWENAKITTGTSTEPAVCGPHGCKLPCEYCPPSPQEERKS